MTIDMTQIPFSELKDNFVDELRKLKSISNINIYDNFSEASTYPVIVLGFNGGFSRAVRVNVTGVRNTNVEISIISKSQQEIDIIREDIISHFHSKNLAFKSNNVVYCTLESIVNDFEDIKQDLRNTTIYMNLSG